MSYLAWIFTIFSFDESIENDKDKEKDDYEIGF